VTTFTDPVLPDNVTAVLIGDNLYLTVKSAERLVDGRLEHREAQYRVKHFDFLCAVEELPQPCHVNILLPALEEKYLVSESIVSKPVLGAA